MSGTGVLAELTDRWGFGLTELAAHTGVSVAQVRRWARKQDHIPAAAADLLVALAELMLQLHGAGVDEPAGLLAGPVIRGYHCVGWDLYHRSGARPLLRLAGGEPPERVLDDTAPRWRSIYWMSTETFVATDGHLSLGQKTWEQTRNDLGVDP